MDNSLRVNGNLDVQLRTEPKIHPRSITFLASSVVRRPLAGAVSDRSANTAQVVNVSGQNLASSLGILVRSDNCDATRPASCKVESFNGMACRVPSVSST